MLLRIKLSDRVTKNRKIKINVIVIKSTFQNFIFFTLLIGKSNFSTFSNKVFSFLSNISSVLGAYP